MAVIKSNPAIWGIVKPKPLKGFPEGKIRIKLRCNDFAKAFVKTNDSIRCFVMYDDGKYWRCACEQMANYRRDNQQVTPQF